MIETNMKKIKSCSLFFVMCAALFPLSSAAFDIVKPKAEQELIKDAELKDVSISAGVYAGVINFENFSSSYLLGLTVNIPLNEDVFIDVEYGSTTISDAEYRNIGLPLFEKEEINVDFYNVLIGYNLLPGEVYWSKDKTLLSSFYLLAGVGSVNINKDDFVSLSFGIGFRMDIGSGKNVRVEARDRLIDSDILGTDKISNNTEIHIAMSWSF